MKTIVLIILLMITPGLSLFTDTEALVESPEILPITDADVFTPDRKENLVLIHSFATNSTMLAGLEDYLDEYFNVYFIDLPGFSQKVPALESKTMEAYADFAEERLYWLGLDSYMLGGISFGFAVANNMDVDPEKVKAILAIEPYINKNYLHMNSMQSFIYTGILDRIEKGGLAEKFWTNRFADEILSILLGQPFGRTRVVLEEVEPETFFVTAKYLITNDSPIELKKDIPYVLIINPEDDTVDTVQIEKIFVKGVPAEKLLIIYTNIEHYPSDISKKYFESRFKPPLIKEIFDWVSQTNTSPEAGV